MVPAYYAAWRGEIMKTTPCPNLPRPPDIMRAQCPEAKPINYLSDYLWKINRELYRFFPWIFYDLRYGYCLFPDKTLDYGEIKHDGTNLHINILGNDYTNITVFYETYDESYKVVVSRDGYSEEGGSADDAWDDYFSDPTWNVLSGLSYTSLGIGHIYRWQAYAGKTYYKFDTSGASLSPTSALLTLTCDVDLRGEVANPTLRVYSQDFGASADSGDWLGGVLVASQEVADGDDQTIELSISTDYVNIGGDTKFKISLDAVDNGIRLYYPDRLRVTMTDVELKLGYNE